MKSPPSLRRRLLLLLLSLIALVWAGSGYRIWYEARHEVEEVMDASLSQTARLLLTLTRHELEEEANDPKELEELRELDGMEGMAHRYEHRLAFRIFDREGRLLLHSPNAPEGLRAERGETYENRRIGNDDWRLFALLTPEGSVHVGMMLDVRNELVYEILKSTLSPLPVGLLVVAGLVWWAVGSGLRPLERLTGEVVGRDAHDLRRLTEDHTPREVMPLVTALNGLFDRLERAFDNERRFTADAAHELRTPLAAIRIQAQVAQQAEQPEQRRRALRQVLTGIDRATHLVEQLLALARADAQQEERIRGAQADLDRVARQVLEQMAGVAIERGIELEFQRDERGDWQVSGDSDSLAILLRNLVDNALRYTPENGRVVVALERSTEAVTLTVADNGPGIPEEQRRKIFERFHREADQAISGSGLGLSIVERIAELHGTAPNLDTGLDGRGLRVEMRFAHPPAGQGVPPSPR